MDQAEIKYFVEAALLAAGRPLSVDQIKGLFDGRSAPDKGEIRKAIDALNDDYEARGLAVAEVASGFRIQIKAAMAERLSRLWEERPPRYSRALFETLALVAYRQPITRGEIEEIRGVSVSSNIVRTLMERDWIRIVGHRDVPGRPAMFGTTRSFLDYFGLKRLDDLPPLADLADWESLRVQLNLPDVENSGEAAVTVGIAANEDVDALPTEEPAAEDGEPAAAELADDDAPADGPEQEADLAEASTTELPAAAADEAGATPGSDELVVSEWPDPSDARAIATLETRDGDDDRDADRDASAGGS